MPHPVFLVTGANRGVGLEIAAGLVNDHSVDVILACRKREACDAAVAEINGRMRRQDSPSTSTSTSTSTCSLPPRPPPPARARAAPLPLDLSSPSSVFEFVEAMKKEERGDIKLDGIVLNAGIAPSLPSAAAAADADSASPPPSPPSSPSSSSSPPHHLLLLPLPAPSPEGWSPDSVDDALATNHVGHFALVQGLLREDRLKKGARVVAVSSRASAAGSFVKSGEGSEKVSLAALAPRLSSPFGSYSRSKLANVLFCRELARRSSESGGGGEEGGKNKNALSLRVVATSPGLVKTPLARGFALSAASSAVPSWLPMRGAAVAALSRVAAGASALLGQSPERGAASSVFAATADDESLFPGCCCSSSSSPSSSSSSALPPRFAFVHGRKRADWLLSAQARDGELARRLWEATEAVVAEARGAWERPR